MGLSRFRSSSNLSSTGMVTARDMVNFEQQLIQEAETDSQWLIGHVELHRHSIAESVSKSSSKTTSNQ